MNLLPLYFADQQGLLLCRKTLSEEGASGQTERAPAIVCIQASDLEADQERLLGKQYLRWIKQWIGCHRPMAYSEGLDAPNLAKSRLIVTSLGD